MSSPMAAAFQNVPDGYDLGVVLDRLDLGVVPNGYNLGVVA